MASTITHEYIQIHGLLIRTGSYLSDCKGVTLTLIFRSALDLETALVNYSWTSDSPYIFNFNCGKIFILFSSCCVSMFWRSVFVAIGQRFAMMEIKIIVSTLLRRFKFELSPLSAKPVPSMQSVLKPIDGQINLLISARWKIVSGKTKADSNFISSILKLFC